MTQLDDNAERILRLTLAVEQLVGSVSQLSKKIDTVDERFNDSSTSPGVYTRLALQEAALKRLSTVMYGCLTAVALEVLGGAVALAVWVFQRVA